MTKDTRPFLLQKYCHQNDKRELNYHIPCPTKLYCSDKYSKFNGKGEEGGGCKEAWVASLMKETQCKETRLSVLKTLTKFTMRTMIIRIHACKIQTK